MAVGTAPIAPTAKPGNALAAATPPKVSNPSLPTLKPLSIPKHQQFFPPPPHTYIKRYTKSFF